MKGLRYVLLLVGVGTIGCGSDKPARMGEAEAAVGGAEALGPQADPQAALYLKLAKEELTNAKKLADDGEDEEADRMLLRAQVDAQLALSLSRQSQERSDAQQAIDQVRYLQQQQGDHAAPAMGK